MIYITLGTQPCDFSRCMRMVEELVSELKMDEPIVAQTGYTSYKPEGFICFDFISEQQYQKYISSARVIISHAGTGALFSSIKKGKKVIAVARLKEYGEMVDDHQIEIVRKLSNEGYIIDGTHSIREAWKKIEAFTPRGCDFQNSLPIVIEKQLDEWLK